MIKTIYYRGHIDFCNYACSYCPFAKKIKSKAQIELEKKSLDGLYRYLQTQTELVQLMFVPYGEILYHKFFQRELARLSKLKTVYKIGVQSNLSLDADKFLKILKEEEAVFQKIMLWATYHLEFESQENFAKKVNKLGEKLCISAGIVADTENFESIYRLRNELDSSIYLWVNAMDKKKKRFTREMIKQIQVIDPMFCYEFEFERKEEFKDNRCISTNNRYLDMRVFRFGNEFGKLIETETSKQCFFKRKQRIDRNCSDHKKCDCYLGYCNFENTCVSRFFGENIAFRIPEKRNYKALFFDLDGTLTDKKGKKSQDLSRILKDLSKCADLYLATARSHLSAKQKLGRDMRFFKGGVFSDGAFVIDLKKNKQEIYKIEDTQLEEIGGGDDRDIHSDGSILRVRLPVSLAKKIKTDLLIRKHSGKAYLQSKKASKSNGIKRLMKWNEIKKEDVFVMSDNLSDRELFDDFLYTATPLNAKDLSAYYSVELKHLLFLIEEM